MNRERGNRGTKRVDSYFFQKYLCKLVLKYIFKSVLTYIVLNTFKDWTLIFNGNKTDSASVCLPTLKSIENDS